MYMNVKIYCNKTWRIWYVCHGKGDTLTIQFWYILHSLKYIKTMQILCEKWYSYITKPCRKYTVYHIETVLITLYGNYMSPIWGQFPYSLHISSIYHSAVVFSIWEEYWFYTEYVSPQFPDGITGPLTGPIPISLLNEHRSYYRVIKRIIGPLFIDLFLSPCDYWESH